MATRERTPRAYSFGRKLDGTTATKDDWDKWREEFWIKELVLEEARSPFTKKIKRSKNRSAPHFAHLSRQQVIVLATPPWADEDAIANLYAKARQAKQHVDHIVPLRNARVCGLHWEGNLQLMAPKKNRIKKNFFALDKSVL